MDSWTDGQLTDGHTEDQRENHNTPPLSCGGVEVAGYKKPL